MDSDFQAWLEQVAPLDSSDPGIRPAGADRLLREIFDRRGPISPSELRTEGHTVHMALAQEAVALVLRDVHSTTSARPHVEIRRDDEYGLIVSYNGNWSTPAIMSMQSPEATREIADYLQDHVMEDGSVWGAWPTCSTHHVGTYAHVLDHAAVWFCRTGNHAVANIGQLEQ